MFPNSSPIVNINQPQPLSTQPIFGYPMRLKLELPKFDGDEKQSVAWINKEKEYFEIHNIHLNKEKLKYASMQLEGHAYNYYMWWKSATKSATKVSHY
jgi:hypothetical protein